MTLDLPDDADYDIEPELRVRKILEQHTEWPIVVKRNDDKYDTDLEVYQWAHQNEEWQRNLIGYVEVEQADKWYGKQYPDNWVYLTFLERKVRNWDRMNQRFDGLVNGGEKTVYLKFNQEFTNCFAATVEDIYQNGGRTKRSDGSRQGSTLALDFDHEAVHTGIDDCANFIMDYFTSKNDNSNLGQFGGGIA